ncbi:hypothetical protein SeLEV6574_g04182 [Synchytrium endobioticum]|uniref:Vinculin n=1 Tax=Synchytrium endobioticum TaxID=286115 RepID=A0A507D0K3_9FUNG|nr:hypothetical protein SeLEV6574_g04182 [Synchytrium endobioticum]
MYTVTTRSVLSPIAECVSELIQVVSESQARDTPLNDLSSLSRVMDEQVHQLITIARNIQYGTPDDTILADELSKACDEVSVASLMLIRATDDLKNDPFARAPKQTMLDAIRGILSGTTHLVYAVDDSDVRKIVVACDTAITLYSAIPGIPINPPQPLIQLVQQTANALVTVVQLSTKRVSELLQPLYQTRLKGAIKTLQRESPLMVTAVKTLILGGGRPEASVAVRDIEGQLARNLEEIKVIVQTRDDPDTANVKFKFDLGKQRAELLRVQRGLCPKIVAGENVVVTELLDEIVDLSTGTIRMTRDAIRDVRNPNGVVRVDALVKELNSLTGRIQEAVGQALADPRNEEYRCELQTLLDSQSNRINLLEEELRRAIITELEGKFADLRVENDDGVSKRLQVAAAQGDQEQTVAIASVFQDNAEHVVRLATLAVETTGAADPQLAEEIRIKISDISGLAHVLSAASQALAKHPQDGTVLEHTSAVSTAFQGAINELSNSLVQQEGLFNGFELIAAAKTSLEAAGVAYQQAVADGHEDKIKPVGGGLLLAADRIITIAQSERENAAEEAYKEELTAIIRKAENVKHNWANRAIVSARGVDGQVNNFKEISHVLMNVMNSLRDVMITCRGVAAVDMPVPLMPLPALPGRTDKLAPVLPVAEIQRRKSEIMETVSEEIMPSPVAALPQEELPVPLTKEQAKENPILAAAVDLKIATAVYVSHDNVIVGKAGDISSLFTEMSALSAQLRRAPEAEGKARFIQIAREITRSSEAFTTKSNELIRACTDRRLVGRLKSDVERCLTLGQQLRIVAAVKASEPKDVDKEQQLIVCARNLMKTIEESMSNCEAASLRAGRVAGVLFQKRVHSRKFMAV